MIFGIFHAGVVAVLLVALLAASWIALDRTAAGSDQRRFALAAVAAAGLFLGTVFFFFSGGLALIFDPN